MVTSFRSMPDIGKTAQERVSDTVPCRNCDKGTATLRTLLTINIVLPPGYIIRVLRERVIKLNPS